MERTLTGIVVSDKQKQTIIVRIDTHKSHPLYHKRFLVNKRFAAHDEKEEAKLGDKVVIAETRPISKTKHWKLKEIVSDQAPKAKKESK